MITINKQYGKASMFDKECSIRKDQLFMKELKQTVHQYFASSKQLVKNCKSSLFFKIKQPSRDNLLLIHQKYIIYSYSFSMIFSSTRPLKYFFRTCMMNFPKGADLFRIQNEMVQLYTPLRSYGVHEIFCRNHFFLIPLNLDPPSIQNQQQQQKGQEQNKDESTQTQVEKNELILENLRLQKQTLKQFLKESVTKPEKRHYFFYLFFLTSFLVVARSFIDFYYPKTVPDKVRTIIPVESYQFNMHQYSAMLDLFDNKINKYDERFWKMIEDAKEGKL